MNGTKLSNEQIREFGSDRDVTATAEVRDIHLTLWTIRQKNELSIELTDDGVSLNFNLPVAQTN